MDSRVLDRREFIGRTAVGVAAALASSAVAQARKNSGSVIGFIKPFQKLPFSQIAQISAEIGWQGIECPVRKGGTIEPAEAEQKLPELVEALRKEGLELPVIATDVEDATDPLTERVLRTASKLGIRRYRLKHYYYDLDQAIPPQLANFQAKLRDLAQLNGEIGLQGTIQNHSGRNYVGAPVWDIWTLLRDLDRKQMAGYFDIGHATLEGGNAWPLHAKLMEPFLAVVSVKDFIWKAGKKSAKNQNGWEAEWRPMGEGMVHSEFFSFLKRSGFNGPISMHFEYPVGSGKEMIAAMKKDLAVLNGWL